MAIVKTVNIEVNTKKGQKEIKDLNKSIEGVNFEVKQANKSNTDLVDGFSKGGKKASKGLSFITKGFKGLGLAIKAAGIGLVISALASLKEISSQNQKVADAFTTVFETFSIVANQVVTAIINVYESVSKSSENFNALGKVLGSIIKLQDFNNCGKLLKLSIIIFINSPFPEPSSIKLNFFGDPRLCQYPTIQIAIISEKSLEILGAVVKSPFSPNGFFFM